MHDLAGIRTKLYLPSQIEDVDKLVRRSFLMVHTMKQKPSPTIWGNSLTQMHYPGGYEADLLLHWIHRSALQIQAISEFFWETTNRGPRRWAAR